MAAKDKPQKVPPVVIDGFEINAQNVSFQKLQEFSLNLYEKLLYQRKERNHLMLERDKLRTILENSRHDINVAKYSVLNKEEEFERMQEKHRQDILEIEQEVKYMIYDHKINLSDAKNWENNLMTKIAERNNIDELDLLKEKRELKQQLDYINKKHEEDISNMNIQHLKEISDLKNKSDGEQVECEMKFRLNMVSSIEQLTLKHEMEMSELEERKNSHLIELKAIHKIRMEEMKDFFNSITAENLTVINNLKQCMNSMKKYKGTMVLEVKRLKQENAKLQEPLNKSQAEVKNLKRQLINYEKDLLSLKNNKKQLLDVTEEISKTKRNASTLLRKLKGDDKSEILSYFDSSCLNVFTDQLNTDKRKFHLEEWIKSLLVELMMKNKMIKELSKSDPEVRKTLKSIKYEYWNPNQLNYELSIVCKSHNELLSTLEKKLDEFCIEAERSLGTKHLGIRTLGMGPGSLVSKQY